MSSRRTRASKGRDAEPHVSAPPTEHGPAETVNRSSIDYYFRRTSRGSHPAKDSKDEQPTTGGGDRIKRSPPNEVQPRGSKRPRRSAGSNNHEDNEEKTVPKKCAQGHGRAGPSRSSAAAAHDSGYLSEHSASMTSGTTASFTSDICDITGIDSGAFVEEPDPLVWNCCRGPSRDKTAQAAEDLFHFVGWSDPQAAMEYIDEKERKYKNLRDPRMMERHEELEPYMRAILLDWMVEVCEANNLQRETYQLAVDYLDRFLSNSKNIRKNQLQLTGATALFVASKLEEVMPPRAKDFAYVTDGACTAEEILLHEKTMMQVLKFRMYPLTAYAWLEMFLQIGTRKPGRPIKELPVVPNILPTEIAEICRLIEFAMMDVRCHNFSYRYLAATAIYLCKSKAMALRISGLPLEELSGCIKFMKPFHDVAAESEPAECRYLDHYPRKTAYLLQNKNTSYAMVDTVWRTLMLTERNYGYKIRPR